MAVKPTLIVVDVQRDFCEGGALPVRNASSLISPLNAAIEVCIARAIPCVFTRDWHPPNHCSFQSQGGPWPTHCVQSTPGAKFATGLQLPRSALVIDIEKDFDKANMSYSAFENTNLSAELRTRHITDVGICGIATDYCVKATVLDALRCGLHTSVLTDLVRPIDVHVGDSVNALTEMQSAGAVLLTCQEWIAFWR
jgi:nicotinamidase/pyrazinamidase